MRTLLALGIVSSALVLGACGASEDDQLEADFCDDVPALLEDISADLDQVPANPATANEALDEAVSRIEEVQPPEDVAETWERLVTAWSDMRDLIGRADLTDPSANVELAPELQRLQPELVESGADVDDRGKENC